MLQVNRRTFNIWEGIYDRFPKEARESAWDSDKWVDSQMPTALPEIEKIKSPNSVSESTVIHKYPLAPIIALLATQKNAPVRVLDFGGGLAQTFLDVVASLPNPRAVEFTVVESGPICQRGRMIHENLDKVSFHENLPDGDENFDIIHAGSSLHYVRDWKEMLKRFSDLGPQLIMLSGLMAGEIKTFVTYQNYYGSKCPVWFWDIRDILDALNALNFNLIYKSLLASSYLGIVQPLPMDNFPVEYRLHRKCNLIFTSR